MVTTCRTFQSTAHLREWSSQSPLVISFFATPRSTANRALDMLPANAKHCNHPSVFKDFATPQPSYCAHLVSREKLKRPRRTSASKNWSYLNTPGNLVGRLWYHTGANPGPARNFDHSKNSHSQTNCPAPNQACLKCNKTERRGKMSGKNSGGRKI